MTLNYQNIDFQLSFETKFAWFWCIWNFDPHVHFCMKMPITSSEGSQITTKLVDATCELLTRWVSGASSNLVCWVFLCKLLWYWSSLQVTATLPGELRKFTRIVVIFWTDVQRFKKDLKDLKDLNFKTISFCLKKIVSLFGHWVNMTRWRF